MATFQSENGRLALSFRIAFGAIFIKAFCQKKGIRISGPALGRPKARETDRKQKRQMCKEACDRNAIEGRKGNAKRRFELDLIAAKLDETAKTEAALILIDMNAAYWLARWLLHFYELIFFEFLILSGENRAVFRKPYFNTRLYLYICYLTACLFTGEGNVIYRKRWYLANVKLDMFISILYVNIANLKSVPIEIFAEILNVFMIVRNIRQNSDVFYIACELPRLTRGDAALSGGASGNVKAKVYGTFTSALL